MPVCAQAIQQQDGTFLLALDPANTNLNTCGYVVQMGGESNFYSLFDMSPSDALLIASAIGVLWAFAWGVRLIGELILERERVNDE